MNAGEFLDKYEDQLDEAILDFNNVMDIETKPITIQE